MYKIDILTVIVVLVISIIGGILLHSYEKHLKQGAQCYESKSN